jgi:LPPG:FO 2-phospho-L-lactate transferase
MKIAALAGGVGAAKFLAGLVKIVDPEALTVIVNTGDDFQWMGLYICPDLDTITYTLSGMANPATGWGVRDDTFCCLERLEKLGCDTWFRLGDRDLATHLYRTHRLQCGWGLTELTRNLADQNGIRLSILPMTDSPVPTHLDTDEGRLPFQDYFVRRRCAPQVRGLSFEGIDRAEPAPGVLQAIREAQAIIVCPSNPFISISPILAVPGIRDALLDSSAVTAAISPIIAGRAVKGPTAAMMLQLGIEVTAVGVAGMYRDLADIFVIDRQDESLVPRLSGMGLRVCVTSTLMDTPESSVALARAVLRSLQDLN